METKLCDHPSVRTHRARSCAVSILAAVLVATAGLAHADCTPDPDSDGDGVCDPVDNCVNVGNPGQEDHYGLTAGNGSGDACEPEILNVTKVKIRGGNPSSASPKGKVTAKGDFVLQFEDFNPTAITVRIVDGLDLDQVAPAPMGGVVECAASGSGKTIKCKQLESQDTVQTTATFKLSSTVSSQARTVVFSLKISKLAIGGMAFIEPVGVTVVDVGSGAIRGGIIGDCSAGKGQLTCKER